MKICDICNKPHKNNKNICHRCLKRSKEIPKKVFPHIQQKRYRLSDVRVLFIKEKYNVTDVYTFIENNPELYFDPEFKRTRREQLDKKKDLRIYNKSKSYKGKRLNPNSIAPDFIKLEIAKHPDKVYKHVNGDVRNPEVYFYCKICKADSFVLYEDLRIGKSHINHKTSKGEAIVEDFIRKGLRYATQNNTLKCINPETNYPLPYDFELLDFKILIEVQGDQHFRYVEYFHGTEENFEYQLKKDKIKKDFAIESGYSLLELDYDDILSGKYENMIRQEIRMSIEKSTST